VVTDPVLIVLVRIVGLLREASVPLLEITPDCVSEVPVATAEV
jgi:hypothetical protein